MANTQATTNPSMTNQSMHRTVVTRHTTMTTHPVTHPVTHPTMHKKVLMSCRRMTHAQMRRTPRCHSMMPAHHAMMRTPHHTVKATIHTEVKTTN